MRKTKIIATLGPASFNQETISGLIDNGMDVARINMSHYNENIGLDKYIALAISFTSALVGFGL